MATEANKPQQRLTSPDKLLQLITSWNPLQRENKRISKLAAASAAAAKNQSAASVDRARAAHCAKLAAVEKLCCFCCCVVYRTCSAAALFTAQTVAWRKLRTKIAHVANKSSSS